jgi:hypothetical protein
MFIRKYGRETAIRYLQHTDIERCKATIELSEHPGLLKEEIEQSELKSAKDKKESLCQKYGSEFATDYGWAFEALAEKYDFNKKRGKPTFTMIEKEVDMSHLRPYYRMASHNVHANPNGIIFKLGLMKGSKKKLLLAGPSNMGLADPGQGAMITLQQINASYMTFYSTKDAQMGAKKIESNLNFLAHLDALNKIVKITSQSFIDVQFQLEKDEAAQDVDNADA